MEDSRNMFALFEHNNTIDRAVESRVLVADVLAKFERYVLLSINNIIIIVTFVYSTFKQSLQSALTDNVKTRDVDG